MRLFRACDCGVIHCRHNPPDGMKAVKRKNHPGYWFVSEEMNWLERFYRTIFQDYLL